MNKLMGSINRDIETLLRRTGIAVGGVYTTLGDINETQFHMFGVEQVANAIAVEENKLVILKALYHNQGTGGVKLMMGTLPPPFQQIESMNDAYDCLI